MVAKYWNWVADHLAQVGASLDTEGHLLWSSDNAMATDHMCHLIYLHDCINTPLVLLCCSRSCTICNIISRSKLNDVGSLFKKI
jgi:hypothetical protein